MCKDNSEIGGGIFLSLKLNQQGLRYLDFVTSKLKTARKYNLGKIPFTKSHLALPKMNKPLD